MWTNNCSMGIILLKNMIIKHIMITSEDLKYMMLMDRMQFSHLKKSRARQPESF